jgi:hypothetical protein
MTFLKLTLLASCVISMVSMKKSPTALAITSTAPSAESLHNFETDPNDNKFTLKIEDPTMLKDSFFFLVLESNDPEFMLSIVDEDQPGKGTVVMDLTTFSGNLALIMTETYFNGQLTSFKKTGVLAFKVSNKSKTGDKSYKVRAFVSQRMGLEMGRTYTTRTDINISTVKVDLSYNGLAQSHLKKLRFQITAVRNKKDYSLSAGLQYQESQFELNTIFPKTIGGILTFPYLPVCREEACQYKLTIQMSKVKVINIESYLIGDVEALSIQHYEEYYDRTYVDDAVTFYELPFEEGMNEMDVTISLVPVTGTTGLFVNARTLPTELSKYTWKETGPLAKRITIKWEELVQMRAEKSNLFIAVQSEKPGEFLVKVDAHDPGYKGRLNSGIIESGFVGFEEINNYLYFFEVYETQTISFSVSMNVISGDADLFVKKCSSYQDCIFKSEDSLEQNALSVRNSQNSKIVQNTFECTHDPKNIMTACQFLIGVKGKENHGTHFEISLQETKFHRLMVPGHAVPLKLNPDQTVYLKFSNPSRSDSSKLFLNVEALWGAFDVAVSKKNSYPEVGQPATISWSFSSTKLGLYNALKPLEMDKALLGDSTIQGIYFISVKAKSSCSLDLKFYEKNDDYVTVHTLAAGTQVRGEVNQRNEIVYYTIKVSLESQQASSVGVYLTPLRGTFVIFANKNGKLPTPDNKEFYSMNHHLELSYPKDSNSHDEYVIGVKLNDRDWPAEKSEENFQFMINLSYSRKALKLTPGVINQFVVSDNNMFYIEVPVDTKDLLVLKSTVDSYNLKLCARFTTEEPAEDDLSCTHTADDKKVSLYVSEPEILQYCQRRTNKANSCFLHVRIEGDRNQKFGVGFTYNDHPFQLATQTIVTGPTVVHPNAQLNFVYHCEPNKSLIIHFNSKGRDMKLYTKLARGESFDDQNAVFFPTSGAFDVENQKTDGHVTNVLYNSTVVSQFGSTPEILLSVRSAMKGQQMFDPDHSFVLQVTTDAKEILRTQTHTEVVSEDSWNYYTLYNHGNTDSLRVYASTLVLSRIELLLSKGLQSRPPFTNKALASKVGMSSAELSLTSADVKMDPHSNKEKLKGYYTVAVKSSTTCPLTLFWNNNESLNYLEITPNVPSTMALESQRSLFFSFYVQDKDALNGDRGVVTLYVQTDVRASVYLLRTNGELRAASEEEHTWKSDTSHFGGLTFIQIKPTDPNYCTECFIMGSVETEEDGHATMLVNVKHSGSATQLTPGFVFPNVLMSKESQSFKLFNEGSDQIDLTVSMLSGYVSVYIASSPDVSSTRFDESFHLERTLDTHKFIPILPSKYNVFTSHDFYVLVVNDRLESASFTLTVDKNKLKSPIEPGLTKVVHLGPSESTDFVYTPDPNESSFEIRMEIRQVYDESHIEAALTRIRSFVGLYHVNEYGDRFLMKLKKESVSENKLYFSFDISENAKGTFAIRLLNVLACPVALSLDLLNGNYKLLNFNQFAIDRVRANQSILYEGYGDKSKYCFVDLKVCHGEVEVDYFQGNYANINLQNSTETKRIFDKNSIAHMIKLDQERLFLRVTNKRSHNSIYEISVFNEKDIENNPYSEVAEGNDGKVHVELDTMSVRFTPVTLKSTFSNDFYHVVNYTLVLSDDKKVMKYGKNCGRFRIEHVWKDYHMLTFWTVTVFRNLSDIQQTNNTLQLKLEGLKQDTRYYGVVIAKINLFPKEGGYLSPSRSGKVYYDNFVFVTSKYAIPTELVISLVVLVGFFLFMVSCVKGYILGDIERMKNFERLTNASSFDEGIMGMNIISSFEKEFYEQKAGVAVELSDRGQPTESGTESEKPEIETE